MFRSHNRFAGHAVVSSKSLRAEARKSAALARMNVERVGSLQGETRAHNGERTVVYEGVEPYHFPLYGTAKLASDVMTLTVQGQDEQRVFREHEPVETPHGLKDSDLTVLRALATEGTPPAPGGARDRLKRQELLRWNGKRWVVTSTGHEILDAR